MAPSKAVEQAMKIEKPRSPEFTQAYEEGAYWPYCKGKPTRFSFGTEYLIIDGPSELDFVISLMRKGYITFAIKVADSDRPIASTFNMFCVHVPGNPKKEMRIALMRHGDSYFSDTEFYVLEGWYNPRSRTGKIWEVIPETKNQEN